MTRLKFIPLLFLLCGCFFVSVKAQDETAPDAPTANQPKNPGLLQQLNLSSDQVEQIRVINQQNRPSLRAANLRLKEANRNLDAAIYGDNTDEAAVAAAVKEVHAAHTQAVELRTRTEFTVRKVLNPDQLAKFREIRRQSLMLKNGLPRQRNNQPINNPNRPRINRLRNNRPIN